MLLAEKDYFGKLLAEKEKFWEAVSRKNNKSTSRSSYVVKLLLKNLKPLCYKSIFSLEDFKNPLRKKLHFFQILCILQNQLMYCNLPRKLNGNHKLWLWCYICNKCKIVLQTLLLTNFWISPNCREKFSPEKNLL